MIRVTLFQNQLSWKESESTVLLFVRNSHSLIRLIGYNSTYSHDEVGFYNAIWRADFIYSLDTWVSSAVLLFSVGRIISIFLFMLSSLVKACFPFCFCDWDL